MYMYKGTLKRNRRTLFSPIRLSQPNLRGSRFQSTRKPNTAQGSLQGSPERLETGIQDSLTNNWQDSSGWNRKSSGVESRIQDWLGFRYIGRPITCSLTIVLIQHTSVMKHSEVNIFHSIPVIIADRCAASGVLRDAVLSRNSYFVRGI